MSRRRKQYPDGPPETAAAEGLSEVAGDVDSDVWLGRTPDKEAEQAEQDREEHARAMDRISTDKAEREIAAMQARIRELEEEKVRLQEREAEREVERKGREKWLTGDFTGCDPEMKFKVLVNTSENPTQNHPVPVTVRGKRHVIPRGEWTVVPYYVVHALQNARISAVQPLVHPQTGNIEQTIVEQQRYNYTAFPL